MAAPAYEAVPYEDHPVTETHLDNLYVAARRAGLAAARPERARVLELRAALPAMVDAGLRRLHAAGLLVA